MKHATVLLCANVESDLTEVSEIAASAARNGQYLAILVHAPMPTLPVNVYGVMPYAGPGEAETWTNTLNETKQSLAEQVERFQGVLKDADCPGDVRPVLCAEADMQSMVAQSAKFADVVMITSDLRESSSPVKDMLHGILFHSPTGLLINSKETGPRKKILLAWDDSLAASRAVHAALPLLIAADDVVIASFDPSPLSHGRPYEPGAALAVWLGQHGCKVEIMQRPSGGREVATCVTSLADELGADLIISGAYGHSRMRQAIFGGTTRTLIEQDTHPVFLAH